MGVVRPAVREPVGLAELQQLEQPRVGRVGQDGDAKVHETPPDAEVASVAAAGAAASRRYRGSSGSPAVQPPSTGSTTPVTSEAAGEHRKAATPAMSRGSPTRPSGIRRTA